MGAIQTVGPIAASARFTRDTSISQSATQPVTVTIAGLESIKEGKEVRWRLRTSGPLGQWGSPYPPELTTETPA